MSEEAKLFEMPKEISTDNIKNDFKQTFFMQIVYHYFNTICNQSNTKSVQSATFVTNRLLQYECKNPIITFMEQKFRQQIALNMRIERARKGLTQERLAELSGISAKHITKIEKANVTPSAYLIYKIAKALDVSIDTLTNREI